MLRKKIKFWNQAQIPNQCWVWNGGKSTPGGYGKTSLNNKTEYSHRVAWEFFYGQKIPDNLCVLHRCDNPPCINPFHLFLGTKGDNNTDRANKNRSNSLAGENHPQAKLTNQHADNIRTLYHNGHSSASLAKLYGVSASTILKIIRKIRYVK
jgi:hypothetical protein